MFIDTPAANALPASNFFVHLLSGFTFPPNHPQIEEALYKNEWSRMSPLFKDDTFGPVATRPDDGYVLLGGRFGKMPVARDLGEVYAEFEPGVSTCLISTPLRIVRWLPPRGT